MEISGNSWEQLINKLKPQNHCLGLMPFNNQKQNTIFF